MKLFADPLTVGIAAEFDTPEAVERACRDLYETGLRRIDAYVPYEMEGLSEVLHIPRGRIPMAVLIAGLAGAAIGFLVQWWTNAVDYPINVGGRPLNSAPAFLLITFETAILFGSLTAFLMVVVGSRLPEPWNPLFEIDGFERASIDRFWVGIDRRDAEPDGDRITRLLRERGALRVVIVEPEHGPDEITRDADDELEARCRHVRDDVGDSSGGEA